MGARRPVSADWSCLPEPVTANILRQAFHDSGTTLLQWLSISLVCKCDLSAAALLTALEPNL